MPIFLSLLLFSLYEFVPLGLHPISDTSLVRTNGVSPVITTITILSFVVCMLSMIYALSPSSYITLLGDVITMGVLIVTMTVITGYVKL